MPTKRNFTAIGVDGCKGSWFHVRISPEGEFTSGVVGDLACLLDDNEPRRILVDIPISLPTNPCGRQCDKEAKARLRPLKSSVFPAPARSVLGAGSSAEAIQPRSTALTATADDGALRTLPDKPRPDSCGLPMQMLYTTRQHVRAG